MSLTALGSLLIRWRWAVVVGWVAIGIAAIVVAPNTPELLDVRGGSRRVTEAARAEAMLRERFDRPLSEFMVVTVAAPDRVDAPGPRAALDTLAAALARRPYVRSVVSYFTTGDSTFLSRDARTTFLVVALDVPRPDSVGALVRPVRALLAETLDRLPDGRRYELHLTGRGPLDVDVRAVSAEDSLRGELRSLPLTLIVLVLAFGALVAAALPLLVGVLGITISLALIGLLARQTPMSVFVLNLTTMIGLGVGIDYSLLIVTRFREELKRGATRAQAAVRTFRTAGMAVVTSGLTVVVGFAALIATPLVETRSVGIGGLVVVGVAVALSITLLPALLAILGRHIDRPKWLAGRLAWYHGPTVWEKWARTLNRHPRRALVLGGLTIAILTAPVCWIRIGLPAHNWWPAGTDSGEGVETLDDLGVAGVIQPIRVLVEMPEGRSAVAATSLRGLRALSDSLRADPRVQQVRSLVDLRPGTSLLGYSVLYSDLEAARREYPGFLEAYLSRDRRVALLDVIPADSTSLTSAMDLARRARALGASPPRGLKGATVLVGGYAAAAVDLQDDLLGQFPALVLSVLGATGIMLALAFRSVLVPLKAIVMNTLSVSATFGLIVLVFQFGWGGRLFGLEGPTAAIFVVVPVLVFAVVFGLSMDYEVFLLSRIKEAFDETGKNDQATMEGLSATASTITSAALIMILVFGVFAFARVLPMQFLGFGLAVAVLLDATIIRMVLVPAIMHLAGEWNWWPGARRPLGRGR
ncbi:MAG TPA: MMPL family transporter [Gemmatimonadales bacterium]|nr:MMPL family transporter [Gemmatimonadales bacterium]